MADEFAYARAVAVVRAYLDGDPEGLKVLYDGIVPKVRDNADDDPLGALLDQARADRITDLYRELSALVVLFARKSYGSEREVSEALRGMLTGPDPRS